MHKFVAPFFPSKPFATILLAKLGIFDREVEARARIRGRYSELMRDVVAVPHVEDYNTSVHAQCTIQVGNRAQVVERLKAKEIPTAVHYPNP